MARCVLQFDSVQGTNQLTVVAMKLAGETLLIRAKYIDISIIGCKLNWVGS